MSRDAEAAKLGAPAAPPGHVADVALWLLTDEARWVTGALIPVDGGVNYAFDKREDPRRPAVSADFAGNAGRGDPSSAVGLSPVSLQGWGPLEVRARGRLSAVSCKVVSP